MKTALLRRRRGGGGGFAPSIVVTSYPYLDPAALRVGDTLSGAYHAGSYSWAPGGINEASITYRVGGVTKASNYVLAVGDGDKLVEVFVHVTGTGATAIDISGVPAHCTDFTFSAGDLFFTVPAGLGDSVPPTISSTTPADNATGVSTIAPSIVVTFSETIAFGTGNITLRKKTAGVFGNLEVFDIATKVGTGAGKMNISGNVLTINPTADYGSTVEYALRIDSTAIKDTYDNAFAGIADDTTLSWTSAATATAPAQMSPPTVTSTATRITITLASDPSDGGAPINARDIRISYDNEATWPTVISGITSPHVKTGEVPATTGIKIQTRCRNDVDSDPNNWSTSTSIDMKDILFLGYTAQSGTGATYDITNSPLDTTDGGAGGALQQDDVGILVFGFASAANSGTNFTPTNGWTELVNAFSNDETRDTDLGIWWKAMGATPDATTTVPGSNNAANGSCGLIAWFRYVNPTSPFSVAAPTPTTGKDTAAGDPPTITPVDAGAMILAICGAAGDSTPADLTAPSGMTLCGHRKNGGSTRGFRCAVAKVLWTSGAYDPAVFGSSESTTNDSWCAATLALAPY